MLYTLLFIAASPDVRFVTKVEPRSWQPIEPADTERLIETQALGELGKKGLLRLEKSKFAELTESDYSLIIEGRFIEDAGKFTVYMTFSPQKKSDAPSLYVLDTDEVENKSVPEMQKIISALVQRAARRLSNTLEPHLKAIGSTYEAPSDEPQALPLQWGDLDVPRLTGAKGAPATLIDVRKDDGERIKALVELRGHVFDQAPARQATELCVLYDPSPALRADCVEALAPVARTRVETQRLLLYAMRNDVDGNVVRAIANVSKSFVGLSRKEALATWMEVLSDDASPAEAASNIAQMLSEENNVPNLELALSKCLVGQTLVYGKRQACASSLLRKLPPERARAVAIRYFQMAKISNQGAMNAFEDVIETITPKGYKDRLDPQMANLLTDLVMNPRMDRGRYKILYLLRKHPSPDGAAIDKLLTVAKTRSLADDVFHTILEWGSDHPEIREVAVARLKKFDATAQYMAVANSGNPKKDLADTIKRLENKKN